MTTLNGIYSTDDITINGLSSLDLDNLDIDSLIVNGNVDISGNLIISRINPSLIPSLGSTINLTQLFQNSYFDSILREMQIWDDAATAPFVKYDISLAYIYFSGASTNISSTTLNLNSPTINYDGNVVDFDAIDTTFHDGTLTITNNNITLDNSNIIIGATTITPTEISYLDTVSSNIQTQLNDKASLTGTNAFTGTNSFQSLPTSTATPTIGTQLITKSHADANYGRISGANAWTGTNTFNSSLPTSSINPTNNNQLITKLFGDNNYGRLASANGWTGTNTFNSNLPTSTLTPTSNNQFITKIYGDSTYPRLSIANSWTEINTFRKGILPCRGTGTNPESDIQIGNNQLSLRQATSANNIAIGADSLIGCTGLTFQQYNTGNRNIAIGQQALQNLDAGNDNIFIGYQAGRDCGNAEQFSPGITPYRCIAIGSYSQFNNRYAINSISIGHNTLVNALGPAANNICMGTNVGNGLTFQNGNVQIGPLCGPLVDDNNVVIIGTEALGAYVSQFNSSVAIGYRACYQGNNAQYITACGSEVLYNISLGSSLLCAFGYQTGYNHTTGSGCSYYGAQSGYDNTTGGSNTACGYASHFYNQTGSFNTSLGTQSGFQATTNLNYTLCLGYNSQAVQSNECVLGGENVPDQVFLTLPNKHRLSCNQSPSGATINLTFRTNENVFITDNLTDRINLPAATSAANIGAKFNIYRQASTVRNILIYPPAGQSYCIQSGYGAFFTGVTAPYTMIKSERYLTVVCINSTGTTWLIQSSNADPVSFDESTSTLNVARSTDIVSITGTILYRDYRLSSVNPTTITGATTLAPPLYEYNKVNLSAGTITLPATANVEIGTVLRFRKIGNLATAVSCIPNTGQNIYARNTVTTVTTAVTLIPANNTYGSVILIDTTTWAITD